MMKTSLAVFNDEDPLLPNMSENFDEEKTMINVEKNEVKSIICKPETQTVKKASKVIVDKVLEGIGNPTDKAQNTKTEAVTPANDCFEKFEQNFSDSESKQKSSYMDLDIVIEKPMVNIENNEIDTKDIYEPETQVARKTLEVSFDNVLEDNVVPTKEIQNVSTKLLRPADDCIETVDRNFSGSERKQKKSGKKLDNLIETSSSN